MNRTVEMSTAQYEATMNGLINTACEKIISCGQEGASEDIAKIKDMIDDLECFWNSDGSLSQKDWLDEFQKAVENI